MLVAKRRRGTFQSTFIVMRTDTRLFLGFLRPVKYVCSLRTDVDVQAFVNFFSHALFGMAISFVSRWSVYVKGCYSFAP
jgi:hypothetical protein